MRTYRIGEKIEAIKDYEIEKSISNEKIKVKKGDEAIITSKGNVRYISGDAKDMIQKFGGVQIKGYDHKSIADMIYNHLNKTFDIGNSLENNCSDEMIDEIEYILMDIL